MYDALIRSLRGLFVILLVAFVVNLGLVAYKGAVPEQVEHTSINISHADLSQARAKWAAQNISVYEVTAIDPRITSRLRVNRSTGEIFLLQLSIEGQDESVDGLNAPVSGVAANVYSAKTVDATYDAIATTLAAVAKTPPTQNGGAVTTFNDYVVQFDPAGSFPVRFSEYARTTLSSDEITWRTVVKDLQFKDFAVIK